MIVPCSITLEDVEYDFHTKSLEVFSFDKVDDEDVHEVKGDGVVITITGSLSIDTDGSPFEGC